jgi:hypothetical protein
MADLIIIALTQTYQIEVYDSGTVVDSTLFNYLSNDTNILDVDSAGLVTPNDLGVTTVTVTRIKDNSVITVSFEVGQATHDYHVAVQIQPAPPVPPVIVPLKGKLLTANCNCTLVDLTNGVEGLCQLQVGQVRLPGSTAKAYRFILYKEVYGKGLVAARSNLFMSWPAGEVFTLVHPAVGILSFKVDVGSSPVLKGSDDIQIGEPSSTLGVDRYVSTVSPTTNVEAMWVEAIMPVPTPPVDPNAF